MLKPKLSYANVAATLALVFSMTGSAIAAHHYLITSTKQISPKVVKALTGKTGKTGPTGPTGPPGAPGTAGKEGKEGPSGKNGATNVVIRYTEVETGNGNDGSAEAKCNPGERATGGGTELREGNSIKMYYFQPGGRPSPDLEQGETPTGWYAGWFNESGQTNKFRVYVVCAAP